MDNFEELVPNMALEFPFDLDQFQVQIKFDCGLDFQIERSSLSLRKQ